MPQEGLLTRTTPRSALSVLRGLAVSLGPRSLARVFNMPADMHMLQAWARLMGQLNQAWAFLPWVSCVQSWS